MHRWLNPERIDRLRQKQESTFTPIFLHRPLAILLLIPIADVRWVTPNRLTTLNILLRLVAAALVWPQTFGGLEQTPALLWTAVGLWHLGGTLDAADGALARYRGSSSAFGRFYDKVSDRLVTLSLALSLSARAFVTTDNVLYVHLAMIWVAGLSACSVAKWIELGLQAQLAGKAVAEDPGEVAAPKRTPKQWIGFLSYRLLGVFTVTEMDFPLWGSIALVTGKEHWLFVYLGLYAIPYTVFAIGRRGRRIILAERRANRERE